MIDLLKKVFRWIRGVSKDKNIYNIKIIRNDEAEKLKSMVSIGVLDEHMPIDIRFRGRMRKVEC